MEDCRHVWMLEMGTRPEGTCSNCGESKQFNPIDMEQQKWSGRTPSPLGPADFNAARESIRNTQDVINTQSWTNNTYMR